MDTPMMARVNRERVLLVGGQRALVMQLAHPLVSAGVAQHSDFPARALERLRRTLDLSLTLIYGSQEEARKAAASIRAVHDRVTGVVAGTAYSANDPRLLLWVNATLIDTTLLVYERFVRRLADDQRRLYYDETRESAALFGIDKEFIPTNLDAFTVYMDGMLSGAELSATDDSRRLVADVLRPPLPLALRPPTALVRQVTLALLPERIRDMFDLRAGRTARLALTALSATSRAVLPWTPRILREFTRARASR